MTYQIFLDDRHIFIISRHFYEYALVPYCPLVSLLQVYTPTMFSHISGATFWIKSIPPQN